jgi:N-methylhydantoinase B/oxoprolinase/acetone carboxylase alpha subunit
MELAAEEMENGDTAANEVAGGTGWTAPERELKPAAGQVAPFTTSA